MKLRALGFCGADDSVHPNMLVMIANSYPLVEFGILFRPDKEGQPRYATESWVERLSHVMPPDMKLAAHLCGSRVNDILEGKADFVEKLRSWGFKRVQINATAVNGVDTSKLDENVHTLRPVIEKFPDIEFIIQKNSETEPLWRGLLSVSTGGGQSLPRNLSMLVDESKGTGVLSSKWPTPPSEYEIGYAGGIGPKNVTQVLQDIQVAADGHRVWIDMESSLRSNKNGKDVFDLDACYTVIDAVCNMRLSKHPSYLKSNVGIME